MVQTNHEENEAETMHVNEKVNWAGSTYEKLKSEWLLGSGADMHAMTMDKWRKLGQPTVQESQAVLRTASGEKLGAIGKVHGRTFLEEQRVEFETIPATKVKKCLLTVSSCEKEATHMC